MQLHNNDGRAITLSNHLLWTSIWTSHVRRRLAVSLSVCPRLIWSKIRREILSLHWYGVYKGELTIFLKRVKWPSYHWRSSHREESPWSLLKIGDLPLPLTQCKLTKTYKLSLVWTIHDDNFNLMKITCTTSKLNLSFSFKYTWLTPELFRSF